MRSVPIVIAVIFLLLCAAATVSVLQSQTVEAESEPMVWVVYPGDPGNPYVDAARTGLLRAARNREFAYEEFTPADSDRLAAAFVNTSSDLPELVVIQDSGAWSGAVDHWAEACPGTRFVVIDGEGAPRPNVRSISFATTGASYLAGVLAATAAGNRPVAILFGMPHPVLDGFRNGFRAGVVAVSPEGEVEIRYIGSDSGGYADPTGAATIAEELYRNGTAVIFAVCGGSSSGVIDAAENGTGRYVIAADRDQSALGPGVVLGSVVKNVDGIVLAAIDEGLAGTPAPEEVRLGLADGATDLVLNPRFADYASVISGMRGAAERMNP